MYPKQTAVHQNVIPLMKFRRFVRDKSKVWPARRKWTCVAIPLGIFLILCIQFRIASNRDKLRRHFERTAIIMSEWFFKPKPFYGRPLHAPPFTPTRSSVLNQDPVSIPELVSSKDTKPILQNFITNNNQAPKLQLKAVEDDADDEKQEKLLLKAADLEAEEDKNLEENKENPESDEKGEVLDEEDGKKQVKREDKLYPVKPTAMADEFMAPRVLDPSEANLPEPDVCTDWRKLATNPNELLLYKRDFTSHDFTDWYVYVSMFNEAWHNKHKNDKRRPIYVDVAANHAKRWSNTYFFDRCLGWDGVCVEANPAYHSELRTNRHCSLVDTCVSDAPRNVKFSFTEAYGGVVKDKKDSGAWGVDGSYHAHSAKFKGAHKGIQSLKCTTLGNEFKRLKVKKVDFLSLDVEGYEFPVLKGIDWEYTTIDIFVIECKRPTIEGFLREKGYEKFSSILQDDIYIRIGSGYQPNAIFAGWLKTISRSDYKIHPWTAPKSWQKILRWNHGAN